MSKLGFKSDSLLLSDDVQLLLVVRLYPDDLARTAQLVLGFIAIAVNLAIYGWLWKRRRLVKSAAPPSR